MNNSRYFYHWADDCEIMRKGSGPIRCQCRQHESNGIQTNEQLAFYKLYEQHQRQAGIEH